jgi:hypothetical protein
VEDLDRRHESCGLTVDVAKQQMMPVVPPSSRVVSSDSTT